MYGHLYFILPVIDRAYQDNSDNIPAIVTNLSLA